MPESRWHGRVDELVLACADALRTLTPHLHRVGLAWQEGQRYDEVGRIVDAVWASFVVDSALVDPRSSMSFRTEARLSRWSRPPVSTVRRR